MQKNISCWGWGGKQGFIHSWTSLGDSKDLADVIHEQPPCEASRCALMGGNKRTICCRPDDDGRYDRRRRCYFEASIGAAPPSLVEISLSSQRRPIIRWTSDTAINMSSLHFRGVCQAYIIPNSSERFVQ